jgi:signal transduction histidine kinase
VEATESSDVIEVVVADTGPGIPEDERGKVFRRFYRLESSRSHPAADLALASWQPLLRCTASKFVLGDNNPGLGVRLRFAKKMSKGLVGLSAGAG